MQFNYVAILIGLAGVTLAAPSAGHDPDMTKRAEGEQNNNQNGQHWGPGWGWGGAWGHPGWGPGGYGYGWRGY
ncbi:Uncharacterized protein PECH_002634 [Penicillium ucsense]|uniref:Uncharacterized protein n=1 Tax=Penicillium ucsense TaxID=2839758 RepID=A0A8J8W8J5_9EURO|nr:Uncharacterized protein PECM_000269 [Penicillium ucsense]KAF7730610.1 Uncharacterized protein PECH_002634 [Penicillium ucsense]